MWHAPNTSALAPGGWCRLTQQIREHLRTLGLEPGATSADIKQAYRQLAIQWHPDRHAQTPEMRATAERRMVEINSAYQYLKTHFEELENSFPPRPGTRPTTTTSSASSSSNFSKAATPTSGTAGQPLMPPLPIANLFRFPETVRPHTPIEVAFTPEGTRLAAVSSELLVFWGLTSEATGDIMRAERGDFTRIVMAPNGRYFAVVNPVGGWFGGQQSLIRVFYPKTGREVSRFAIGATVTTLAFSPEGKQLAVGDAMGVVSFWEAETGKPAASPIPNPRSQRGDTEMDGSVARVLYVDGGQAARQVVIMRKGRLLTDVSLWEVRRSRQLRTYSGHIRDPLTYGSLADIGITQGGKLLVVANNDPANRRFALHLWDTQSGGEVVRAHHFVGHTAAITCIAVSPSGKTFLSGSLDGTIRLWDIGTGKELRRGVSQAGGVHMLVYSPDGRSAASTDTGNEVTLWKIEPF